MEMWELVVAEFSTPQIIPHIVAIAVAYILAIPIGWNREVEDRSAGLRTFPLVAVAACGFLQATESMIGNNPEATARIIEGIITGIGFIGGGAILQMKDRVQGTATAASVWATGAIGVAVGCQSYDVAVIIMITTFFTLGMLSRLKKEVQINGAEDDSVESKQK